LVPLGPRLVALNGHWVFCSTPMKICDSVLLWRTSWLVELLAFVR